MLENQSPYRNILWSITIALILGGYGWSYMVFNMVETRLTVINNNLVRIIENIEKRVRENERVISQRGSRLERLEREHDK